MYGVWTLEFDSHLVFAYCEDEDCNGQIQGHLTAFVSIGCASWNVLSQTCSNCARNLNHYKSGSRFEWRTSLDLAYHYQSFATKDLAIDKGSCIHIEEYKNSILSSLNKPNKEI